MTQYSKCNYTKGVDRVGNSLEKKSKRVGVFVKMVSDEDGIKCKGLHHINKKKDDTR